MGKTRRAFEKVLGAARTKANAWNERAVAGLCRARARAVDEKGQGTTEYAILVGVLVVIAILAITVFRPKLQELWDAISNGINSL